MKATEPEKQVFSITGEEISRIIDCLTIIPVRSYDETMAKAEIFRTLETICKKVTPNESSH